MKRLTSGFYRLGIQERVNMLNLYIDVLINSWDKIFTDKDDFHNFFAPIIFDEKLKDQLHDHVKDKFKTHFDLDL